MQFGLPPHRGCEGGKACEAAFKSLGDAVQRQFKDQDPLIQALALHFHFAAMHPFLDGNGRTARAVEALMLQRAGLTDHLFIAMSNYYYDEKNAYLAALSAVTPPGYDITPFLLFGLRGIKIQCERLFGEIRFNVAKSIFKNTMHELFGRLETRRKRIVAERQLRMLNVLLEQGEMSVPDFRKATESLYAGLKAERKTWVSDFACLINLEAIKINDASHLEINLNWPQEITESGFLEKAKKMPKAKSHSFLTGAD